MATHYIETSIPSFYYEVRTEPTMAARREWTRNWWDNIVATDRFANANKFGHIRRVNGILGLFVPALVTPMELLGAEDNS